MAAPPDAADPAVGVSTSNETAIAGSPDPDGEKLVVKLGAPDALDRVWRLAVAGELAVRHLKPVSVSLESASTRR